MKVGIIGAGTMGQGIAQAFAQCKGFEVTLSDVSIDAAKNGRSKIEKNLNKQLQSGKIDNKSFDRILNSINAASKESLSGHDLIIEAVIENMEIKKTLFKNLDILCKEETIFASNTSSLSITEIASAVKRPLVGMHFFNPVPAMKLVEIIRAMDTPDDTVLKIREIAEKIGKVPVEVSEQPGFVVNRILVPMINEAICIYAEGCASMEDIDTAMKLGANHPIGPLALGDLVGLDVCLAIMEVMHNETCDPKYRPSPLLKKMVRGGRLGRKSGQGFYIY